MAVRSNAKSPKSKKAKRATVAASSESPVPDLTTDISPPPEPTPSPTPPSAVPAAKLPAPSPAAAASSGSTGQNVVSNLIRATETHPAIARRGASSNEGDENALQANPELYTFRFDSLCTPQMSSEELYTTKIAPIVRAAAEGFNATVFAYGQTGSGKTHTMSGAPDEPGIIPRAVEEIFDQIESDTEREYLLRVSYLEIYNESLKDLLATLPSKEATLPSKGTARKSTAPRPSSPTKGGFTPSPSSNAIRIVEDQAKGRIVLTGIREEIVTSPGDVLRLLDDGQRMRHVGATDWNERSSRSHCVFQITIESRGRAPDGDASGENLGSRAAAAETRISQLNLIDLAGSERAATDQARRKEGAFINKSLLTLGTVISKLGEADDGGDVHIPYRDSKLTRLLQTSLSGNARVAVICTVSPDERHATESLSTLKFGKRCRLVRTSAKRGVVMDDRALLLKYRAELETLRAQLAGQGNVPIRAELLPGQEELTAMEQKRDDLRSQITHLTNLFLTSKSVAAKRDVDSSRPRARRGRLTDFPTPSVERVTRLTPPTEGDIFASEKEMAKLRRAMADAESKAKTAEEEVARAKAAEASALEQLEEAQQRSKLVQEELAQAVEEAIKVKKEAEQTLNAAKEEAAQSLLQAQAEADKALAQARAEGDQLVSQAKEEAEERLQVALQESSSASTAREEAHHALSRAKEERDASVQAAHEEAKQAISSVQKEAELTLQKVKEESSKALEEAKAQAEQSLSSVKEELETLQLKLAQSQKDSCDAADREIKARGELTSLGEEADALRSEVTGLRSELSNIKESLEKAKAATAAAQADAEEFKRAHERARTEQAALAEREEALQGELKEMREALAAAEAEAEEHAGKGQAALAEREEALQGELKEMREALAAAEAEAEERAGKGQAALAEREEALQGELKEMREALAAAEAEAEERAGKGQAALAEREEALQGELKEMREALAAAEAEAEEARNDASRLTELAMSAHEALKSERQKNEEANDFAAKEQERILSLALQSREQADREKSDALQELEKVQKEAQQAHEAQVRAEQALSELQTTHAKSQETLTKAKKTQEEMQQLLNSVVSELNQLRPQVPTFEQKRETEAQAQRLQETLASLEEERALREQLEDRLARTQQGHLDVAGELDEARREADQLSAQVASLRDELAQGRKQRDEVSTAQIEQLSRDLQASEDARAELAARVEELEKLLSLRREEPDPDMKSALSDANTKVDSLTCTVSEQQVVISELEAAVDTWKGKLKSQHDLIIRLISASSGGDMETLDAIRRVIAPTPLMQAAPLPQALEPVPAPAQRTPVKSSISTSRGTTPSRRPPPGGTHWLYTQPEPLPLHPNSEAGKKVRPRKTIEKDLALLRQSPHVGGKREVFVHGATPKRSASPPPSQKANTSFSFRASVSPAGARSKTPSKLPGFATENSPSPSPLPGRRLR